MAMYAVTHIGFKPYVDLDRSSRPRRQIGYNHLPEVDIVLRFEARAFKDSYHHVVLVVRRSSEDLSITPWGVLTAPDHLPEQSP